MQVNLCVSLFGSYGFILGIKWLIVHKTIVNYEDKIAEFLDDLQNLVVVNGVEANSAREYLSYAA